MPWSAISSCEFTQGSSGDPDTLDGMDFGVDAVALEVSDVPDVHALPFAAHVDEDVRGLLLCCLRRFKVGWNGPAS